VDEYEENIEKDRDCSKFRINKNNDYIISAESNRTDIVLFSNLVLNVNLVKKGKVSLLSKYQFYSFFNFSYHFLIKKIRK